MQPSRRAFLTAARLPVTPWRHFYGRLARSVQGRLEDRSPGAPGAPMAWLQPARLADVWHAHALCVESDVRMQLAHAPAESGPGPSLVVDLMCLDEVERLADGSVRAEAGARVGAIRRWLPGACAGAADADCVASWLADPVAHAWPVGELACSGLQSVELMLAAGDRECFGAFGAAARRPALSGAASHLVSSLFAMAAEPALTPWREFTRWPARYRLDALFAPSPNLAHLLLGGTGTLAWPERVVLGDAEPGSVRPAGVAAPAAPDGELAAALDERVKRIFDPRPTFACLPQSVVVQTAACRR